MSVAGYNRPGETRIPDVVLTGDEFLHMLALQGEVLPGAPTAHTLPRAPRGFPSPDCRCCCSIMAKSASYQNTIARMGVR